MAFRIIEKLKVDKQNNIVQLVGLTLSILSSMFIFQYVLFEYSFDKFNKHNNSIYRTGNTVSMKLGSLAEEKLHYLEESARLHPCYRNLSIQVGTNTFIERGAYYADGSLFSIFTFPVISGDARKALSVKNQLVISEQYAKKYFGKENPIGKTIIVYGAYEKNTTYTVGAVFKDIPENSHLQFNMLFSIENILANDMYVKDNPWKWENFFTYFKTNETVEIDIISSNLSTIANENGSKELSEQITTYSLFGLNELHLNGEINYMDNNRKAHDVYIWVFISLVIMAIAWLNYININISSMLKNNLALGVKKVFGASSFKLWLELFYKALLVNCAAFILSLFLYLLITPAFERLSGLNIELPVNYYVTFWLSIFSIQIFGTLLVSLVLNNLMNRQKLIQILSKRTKMVSGKKAPWVSLFVVQFSISIVLICFAIFSSKQVDGLMSLETGIETQQVLALYSAVSSDNGTINEERNVFESEALKIPGVINTGSSAYIPGSQIDSDMPTSLLNKSSDEEISTRMNFVSYSYIPLLKHKLIAGRNFSNEFSTDHAAVIINKSLAQAYGFNKPQEAIGKKIFWKSRNQEKTIIGVIDNFNQQSADVPIEPTMFHLWNNARGFCLLRLESDDLKRTVAEIQTLWNRVHPGNTFEYLWLDEHYSKQFKKWIRYSQMLRLFSLIAILIACVGLFGLSSMLLNNKTKEIGIRKVNGATITEIMQMLNISFVKWMAVSFVIAIPIAYYSMSKWLENFAYKTTLSWWVYVLAGLISLVIVLLTVSGLTYRAARRNPVEALRYE